jgi:hypothetical protein
MVTIEMAQQVKMVYGAKPDNPSLIPRIYTVGGGGTATKKKLQSLGVKKYFYEKSPFLDRADSHVLSSDLHTCAVVCIYSYTCTCT